MRRRRGGRGSAPLAVTVGLCIQVATQAHQPVLSDLRRQVGWGAGGLEGSFLAVAEGRQVILIAEYDGGPVGAVTVNLAGRPNTAPRTGHISDLLVVPLWRRRGIGGSLLRAAEQVIRERGYTEATLDVEASNAVALHLYQRSGYRRLRTIRFPWGPGYTMRKVLDPAPDQNVFSLWRWLGMVR